MSGFQKNIVKKKNAHVSTFFIKKIQACEN